MSLEPDTKHTHLPAEPLAEYLYAAIAPRTRAAYREDLLRFLAWGGTVPATAEQIARYLAAHAATPTRWRPSPAGRSVSALSFSKKLANHIGTIQYFIARYNLELARA